jgi:hypothetical protein
METFYILTNYTKNFLKKYLAIRVCIRLNLGGFKFISFISLTDRSVSWVGYRPSDQKEFYHFSTGWGHHVHMKWELSAVALYRLFPCKQLDDESWTVKWQNSKWGRLMVPEIALLTKDFGVKADQNQCGLVSMTYLFPRSLQNTVNLHKTTVSSFLRQFVDTSADQGFFPVLPT